MVAQCVGRQAARLVVGVPRCFRWNRDFLRRLLDFKAANEIAGGVQATEQWPTWLRYAAKLWNALFYWLPSPPLPLSNERCWPGPGAIGAAFPSTHFGVAPGWFPRNAAGRHFYSTENSGEPRTALSRCGVRRLVARPSRLWTLDVGPWTHAQTSNAS